MGLRNAKVSAGLELFPVEVLEKAVEKSSKVLHDEAIRKAVSSGKPASREKKLHFSNTLASGNGCNSSNPRNSQGPRLDRCSGPLPRCCDPPKLLLLPLVGGRGRSFEGFFCLPHSRRW